MSQAPQDKRTVVSGVQKMTPSEAFVETMVANGVTDIFGIMGSAFMTPWTSSRPPESASCRWCMSKALRTWPTATPAYPVATAW